MDEQTSTPDGTSDDAGTEEGTFLGGSFGGGDEDDADAPDTTAEQLEAQTAPDGPAYLAGGARRDDATVPAEVQEQVTGTSDPGSIPDDAFPSDVEGTSTEPAPGERNDPV
ncbi:hypothetical protein [uncultured Ornithinimicrobium sp.]|jgi:hypothetical protein|uniref:hypothetical protein n=1 Tax=uncultured Ornithinimicrobium sp. TaxID=259307 RepID=UPI0025947E3A|nr:hypothetical protein [uncultured Ornithinimicrobium sp.]